jgi:hypothetical protein
MVVPCSDVLDCEWQVPELADTGESDDGDMVASEENSELSK